jgi:tetratricopeptide (TPR) repeat protein
MNSRNAGELILRALGLESEYTGTIKERPNLDERVHIWETVLDISGDLNSDAGEHLGCSLRLWPSVDLMETVPIAMSALGDIVDVRLIIQLKLAETLGERFFHTFSSDDNQRHASICEHLITPDVAIRILDRILLARVHASYAHALVTRYDFVRSRDDLEEARKQAETATTVHDNNPLFQAQVGDIYRRRFLEFNNRADLSIALDHTRRAYNLSHNHKASRGWICLYHGLVYIAAGNHSLVPESPEFWSELTRAYRGTLRSLPNHQIQFESWYGLALVASRRYVSEDSHLLGRKASACYKVAIDLVNPKHPRAASLHRNYAYHLGIVHNRTNSQTPLNQAIYHARCAHDLCGATHIDRSGVLGILAITLTYMTAKDGEPALLDELVSRAREAVQIATPLFRSHTLLVLSNALLKRFRSGNHERDLRECIDCNREASVISTGYYLHSAKQILADALLLLSQCSKSGELMAIDEAITICESLLSSKLEVRGRIEALSTLGEAHRLRYLAERRESDLDAAIAAYAQVVEDPNIEGAERHLLLNDLSRVFLLSFKRRSSEMHAHKALKYQEEALALTGPEHTDRPQMLVDLAILLCTTGSGYYRPHDGFTLLDEALSDPNRDSQRKARLVFRALRELEETTVPAWTTDDPMRTQLLDTYRKAVEILPCLASAGLQRADRVEALASARTLAVDAANHALLLGDAKGAIEVLEAGRAVFWSQHLRLHGSLRHHSLPAHMIEELKRLSEDLAEDVHSQQDPSLDENTRRVEIERSLYQRRLLSDHYETLLAELRSLPGFEDYLRPAQYASLRIAAKQGPIVILLRSWMILMLSSEAQPMAIPLVGVTEAWLVSRSAQLGTLTTSMRRQVEARGVRKAIINEDEGYQELQILEDLWHHVAKPCIDALKLKVCRKGSRSSCNHATFLTARGMNRPQVRQSVESGYVPQDYGHSSRCMRRESSALKEPPSTAATFLTSV